MKKSVLKDNKNEIFYHLINSALSGLLVIAGAFTTGNISDVSIVAAIATSLIVAVTKFKEYWDGEKTEYSTKLFHFF